ncbi:Tetratricopeptide (TPR) repeat protein OS=Streptomyces griseomycini OX=66895 GN=FHS37_004946 PE=4 SV=1 [Streptomyces griseomycini]
MTGRVLHLVHASLPASAARTLRLLSLAPAGLVDPHTASALAGCSVDTARTALDGFVAHGLLHAVASPLPQYEVPGCLHSPPARPRRDRRAPRRAPAARPDAGADRAAAPSACRAITETDSPLAREKLLAMPRSVRFPSPRAAADWLRLSRPALLGLGPALAVADGELDTLARRLLSQPVTGPPGGARRSPGRPRADLQRLPPRPGPGTSPSAGGCPASGRRPC